jgi:hypothetical protein
MVGTGLVVLLVGCLGGSAVALVTDSDDDPLPPTPPQPTAGGPTATESPDEPDNPGGSGGLRVGEERDGEGPTIIPLDLSGADHHTLSLSYSGEGFFSARLVDADGEYVESLGSGSDGYTGIFPADVGVLFGDPAAVDITDSGEGTWTVGLADLNDSPLWPEQTEGEGDVVLRIDPDALDGPTTITGSHDGESNFIVWAYSGAEDIRSPLLFNEIGEFSGESTEELSADQIVLHVQADGAWTVAPS